MQKIKTDLNMGENLRALRLSNKFTQNQIVAKLNFFNISVTRSTYSRYETGELNISVATIVALHKIYNCSYEDFFNGLT